MRLRHDYNGTLLCPAERGVQHTSGFSLIELVAVVSVLAILSAIAIPIFDDVRKNALINSVKYTLVTVTKECILASVTGPNSSPRFADIKSWSSYNKYGPNGGHPGWGFIEWTFDTGMYTAVPIKASDSCYSLAAMSATTETGNIKRLFPDFLISYDPQTGQTTKTCVVKDPGFTHNKNHCSPTGTW